MVSPPSPLPPHLADVVSEPKAAALEALTRFLDGESAEDIASKRGEKKAIQRGTVLGYLGDCIGEGAGLVGAASTVHKVHTTHRIMCARDPCTQLIVQSMLHYSQHLVHQCSPAHPSSPPLPLAGAGYEIDLAQFLEEVPGLSAALAGVVAAALQSHGSKGLRAVKDACGEGVEYWHVKVVAGLVARQVGGRRGCMWMMVFVWGICCGAPDGLRLA